MTKTPMATCYLDANIIISYLFLDHVHHQRGKSIIESLALNSTYSVFISSLVLDEVIMGILKNAILMHKRSKAEALDMANLGLEKINNIPRITLINPPTDLKSHTKIISIMKRYALKPRDAYHLLTMKHHKIKYFATLDHDFSQVFDSTPLKHFSI
jgi:predicted nucleic acid-binding protein